MLLKNREKVKCVEEKHDADITTWKGYYRQKIPNQDHECRCKDFNSKWNK